MAARRLVSLVVVVHLFCPGCITLPRLLSGNDCAPQAQSCEGGTIRVKAPPQKIVIEQPQYTPGAGPCKPESAPEKGKPESAPEKGKPESAPERARPEAAPRREAPERRPEAEVGAESAAGTLAALGQIASLTRTTAMTAPLGTVNPGATALGIGVRWIHIPIPVPRLFSVNETPSVTVPLSEANLMPYGYGTGLSEAALSSLLAAQQCPAGRTPTPRELAALVAQELAMQQAAPLRRETRATGPPPDNSERQQLEKKLSDAEAQIERLSQALQSLDKKLPGGRSNPDK